MALHMATPVSRAPVELWSSFPILLLTDVLVQCLCMGGRVAGTMKVTAYSPGTGMNPQVNDHGPGLRGQAPRSPGF